MHDKSSMQLASHMTQEILGLFRAFAFSPAYMAREWIEFLKSARRYYRNTTFRHADLHCLAAYLLQGPDRICQHFLRSHPDEKVQRLYGETFFTTLEAIAHAVRLSADDVVYDLGSGRGRSVFWFNAMYGCRAVGVEINPVFVWRANRIKEKVGIRDVEFLLGNLMDVDYRDATLIYFYGTAFSDEAIEEIANRFRNLRPGTRVVSVSYPLTHYTDGRVFDLEKTIKGKFVWGSTDIYIQRKL